MRSGTLDVLRCPTCRSAFEGVDPRGEMVAEGRLQCRSEGIEFAIVDGIPRLVALDQADRVRALADSYSAAWTRDGWGSTDPEYYLHLPWKDSTRMHSREWRVKARSMVALFRILERWGPKRILDLGCGMGWLSHYLALRNFDVYALDITLDAKVGLGAATAYARRGPPFECIWGEMARLPFADEVFDVVVCNASLHYAEDLESVLRESVRVLRPAGNLVVMNSPVYRDAASAARALRDFQDRLRSLGATDGVTTTYHHFDRAVLAQMIERVVGPVAEERFDPGLWFRSTRRARGIALRMELASFPIFTARRMPPESGRDSPLGAVVPIAARRLPIQ